MKELAEAQAWIKEAEGKLAKNDPREAKNCLVVVSNEIAEAQRKLELIHNLVSILLDPLDDGD